MKGAVLLALAGLLAGTPLGAQVGAAPTVRVEGGLIAGMTLPGGRVAFFRGIPYAAPPVGPLRWRPPQPARPWRGVRMAAARAPACPQMNDGWNHQEADRWSEDCLTLDVATPSANPEARLPVLVWIHGGSNKAGSSGDNVLSSMSAKGVVLVAIQYRLGALGFMAHPALSAESPWRSSGNWGLMDQQAALRWVRRNIARFGGDPANVTIAGESAGAQDVSLQTLSPLARGLYRNAVEESGTASFGFPTRSLATSERYGAQIAAAAGAGNTSAAALRALPVAAILRAERAVHYPGLVENGTVWLQTTIDGHVVPGDPRRLFAEGRINPGPLIVGWNAQEIGFYKTPEAAAAAVRGAWGADAATALPAYGLDRANAPAGPVLGTAAMRVSTDIVFRCPTLFVAAARARAGLPTWVYRFDYDGDGVPVTHSAELRAVFGAPGEGRLPAGAPPMQAYWTNLARTGDPNGANLPFWPRWRFADRLAVRFGNDGVHLLTPMPDDPCAALQRP